MLAVQGSVAVFQPDAARAEVFWDDMSDGFVRSIQQSHEEVSLDTIRALVSGGIWRLWMASDGKSPIGACVTEEIEVEQGTWCGIPFLWSDSIKAINTMFRVIEDWAKSEGYIGVKWISSNERAEIFASRHGYRPRYTEFIKRFGEE
jgi:hypothetical protein